MHLAEALTPIGVSVWIPDLRGHGDTDSGTNRGYLADKDGFERVVQDLIEMGNYASSCMGELPLFYFGHSFGALIGMALIATYGKYLHGAVLSSPPEKQKLFMDKIGGLMISMGGALKGLSCSCKATKSDDLRPICKERNRCEDKIRLAFQGFGYRRCLY